MVGPPTAQREGGKSPSPEVSDDSIAGTKRKPESELSPKRVHKTAKKQTTIEETLGDKHEDTEMKDTTSDRRDQADIDDKPEKKALGVDAKADDTGSTRNGKASDDDAKLSNTDVEKDNAGNLGIATKKNGDGPIEESSQRAAEVPSNILEKGIIYFFTRNRVGITDSDSVGDLQRTFFVLRPIPTGAKLGDGALVDQDNIRLLALPKKVFPKSHNDKFMAFVEKANTTIKDLKENFFSATRYDTKTKGSRRDEPVNPVAEGVYAITRTEDATSHLVYSITIPSELGEVQKDLGIKDTGSFVISAKNPERPGNARAQLPQKPDFPKEIISQFRNLAWSEVKPKYLDYEYCQILLIGETVDSAVEPTKKDQKHNKETPQEELEKLEHEDELRIQHLHGDDSVFDDLEISKTEYSQIPTTW